MKFELAKETAVEKTYLLAGRTLQPGGMTKFWYGLTGAATASAFFFTPEFFIGSALFGSISAFATWYTSQTLKESLDREVAVNRERFKRKNRKEIAKDGTRELISHSYVAFKTGVWTPSEPFESSHEVKIFASREDGKLKFEKVVTELPHTTWAHAFNQLAKEDEIVVDENPYPGPDWPERKKELGMLQTNIYYRSTP